MAYRLIDSDGTLNGTSVLFAGLGRYQAIMYDDSEYDLYETLEERSAFELVREQLTDEQRAELNQVDSYWRAHPERFNIAFGVQHNQIDRRVALEGYVEDADGNTPPIPRSHWWWWPIGEGAATG